MQTFLPCSSPLGIRSKFSKWFNSVFLGTKQSCWYSATFLSPQPSQRDHTSSSRKLLELFLMTVITVYLQLFLPGSCLGQHLAGSLPVFLCSKAPSLPNPQSLWSKQLFFGYTCSVTELRLPLCELCWASQLGSKCKAQGFHAVSHWCLFYRSYSALHCCEVPLHLQLSASQLTH